jgi:hypothetical protein
MPKGWKVSHYPGQAVERGWPTQNCSTAMRGKMQVNLQHDPLPLTPETEAEKPTILSISKSVG